ncbi:MAG: hypothetical protein AN484_17730 [Aphanizomenon flos-aquae WA102]|jgi:hypothetical protein|uniref:Uncharacterized protein n=1 Tax=Aphanizomenon flos-aquae WA102 TaxID=1710896 RepID=A0A1B7WZ92_APHFL|nr:MAG: hypothetical protein AN484_17730 [Aphanizomenon flos-aquae WA102]
MFITFETTEGTKITIDITGATKWSDDQLVTEACQQLGIDCVGYQDRTKKLKKGVTVTPIDWRPLRVGSRQWLTLKRRPLRYKIDYWYFYDIIGNKKYPEAPVEYKPI